MRDPTLKKTDQGIEVTLGPGPGQYTELKVRRSQLSYFDQKTREIVRQGSKDLELIFADTERLTERPIARFTFVEGERERCKESTSLEKKKIPIREVERAFRGLDALEEKAKGKDTARDAKLIIQDLRLPDPNRNPELYRYWGPRHQRRLLILWSCEDPPNSSLPAKQAISKLKTEPNWAGAAKMLGVGIGFLVAALVIFLALQGVARWIVGPPVDLRSPRVVSESFGWGKLEVGSQPKQNGPDVLTLSPVLLTFSSLQGKFDSNFPDTEEIDDRKINDKKVYHFTGFVRAGDYKFGDLDGKGKESTLRVRDVWGVTEEAVRASLVLKKRQVHTGEDFEISLEPSFPKGSIGRYEWAWKRVGVPAGNPIPEASFTELKDPTTKEPKTNYRFDEPGRYYIYGAVEDISRKFRNCAVDVVNVTGGNTTDATLSPRRVQQPPAAIILRVSAGASGNKTGGEELRVKMLGDTTHCWLGGDSKSPYPIEIFGKGHESQPLTLLGKQSEDGFTPRLDTTVSLSAPANTGFKLDDAIERTNRLFVTEETKPEEPQFFTAAPLNETSSDGLTIIEALPTMRFADKLGYVLRAVPTAPEFFHDVEWTFERPLDKEKKKSPGAPIPPLRDRAEVVFFGVAGVYHITVTARITDPEDPGSEKPIKAEATLMVDSPENMSTYEKFLCWLAR